MVLLLFAVDDRASLERLESKWIPEVAEYLPSAALVLVGTKTDLRGDGDDCVTFEEGLEAAGRLNAYQYKELSAMEDDGREDGEVAAVFQLAIEAAVNHRFMVPKRKLKKKECVLL